MPRSIMWYCQKCETGFTDTMAAIEHAAANESVDIWSSYE
jgi:hypothetical protein